MNFIDIYLEKWRTGCTLEDLHSVHCELKALKIEATEILESGNKEEREEAAEHEVNVQKEARVKERDHEEAKEESSFLDSIVIVEESARDEKDVPKGPSIVIPKGAVTETLEETLQETPVTVKETFERRIRGFVRSISDDINEYNAGSDSDFHRTVETFDLLYNNIERRLEEVDVELLKRIDTQSYIFSSILKKNGLNRENLDLKEKSLSICEELLQRASEDEKGLYRERIFKTLNYIINDCLEVIEGESYVEEEKEEYCQKGIASTQRALELLPDLDSGVIADDKREKAVRFFLKTSALFYAKKGDEKTAKEQIERIVGALDATKDDESWIAAEFQYYGFTLLTDKDAKKELAEKAAEKFDSSYLYPERIASKRVLKNFREVATYLAENSSTAGLRLYYGRLSRELNKVKD